jgi:hypothetical protein
MTHHYFKVLKYILLKRGTCQSTVCSIITSAAGTEERGRAIMQVADNTAAKIQRILLNILVVLFFRRRGITFCSDYLDEEESEVVSG